jgi:hypothetical protein
MGSAGKEEFEERRVKWKREQLDSPNMNNRGKTLKKKRISGPVGTNFSTSVAILVAVKPYITVALI